MHFQVIDPQTGQAPDLAKLGREEKWAWSAGLIPDDIDRFLICEDGLLYLMDDCGNVAECPEGRFEVRWKPDMADLLAVGDEDIVRALPREKGATAMTLEVCVCGHGWLYHHRYEEFCRKFIEVACVGGCGCICQEWRPMKTAEDDKRNDEA